MSVANPPRKANPPLVIDANAVLTLSICLQSLQPIAGNLCKVFQRACGVEHGQLAKRDPLKSLELPDPLAAEESLSVGRTEGLDHQSIL